MTYGLSHALLTASILALLSLSCLGWGYLFFRIIARGTGQNAKPPVPGEVAVLGLVVLGALSLMINFVAPVSGIASGLMIGSGLLLAVYQISKHGMTRRMFKKSELVYLGLLLAFYGYWAQGSGWSYDSGLYHLQSLEWIRQEPVALGLANLHTRLAFNSFWLSIVSAVHLPGIGSLGIHSADYLLTMLVLLVLGRPLFDPSAIQSNPVSSAFSLLALIGMSKTLVLNSAPVNLDQAAAMFFILAVYQFLRLSESVHARRQLECSSLCLLACCTAAVLIRITAFPLLFLGAAAMYLCLRNAAHRRVIAAGLTVCATLTAFWLLRNILLSGCLVFPVGFTCSNSLPWSVGAELAGKESEVIRTWARYGRLEVPDATAGIHNWFVAWVKSSHLAGWFRANLVLPMLLIGSCVGLWKLTLAGRHVSPRNGANGVLTRALIVVMPVLVAQLVTWLLFVPDPRFAWGAIFALLAMLGTLAGWTVVDRFSGLSCRRARWIAGIAATLLGSSVILNLHQHPGGNPANDRNRILALYQSIEIAGAEVKVPLGSNQCWQTDIPCTPHVSEAITVKRAGIYLMFRNSNTGE